MLVGVLEVHLALCYFQQGMVYSSNSSSKSALLIWRSFPAVRAEFNVLPFQDERRRRRARRSDSRRVEHAAQPLRRLSIETNPAKIAYNILQSHITDRKT